MNSEFMIAINELVKEKGISKEVLKEADVAVDDILDVKVSNGVIMLVKPFRHKTLEERAAAYDGKLDLDGEFDWREPVGREIW